MGIEGNLIQRWIIDRFDMSSHLFGKGRVPICSFVGNKYGIYAAKASGDN